MNSDQKRQKAIEILQGNPSEIELKDAVQYLQEGVSEGHAASYFTLSQLYYMGFGVELDKQKNYELLCKSLELGYQRAKLMLARCYIEGEVVEKDLAKAKQLLIDLADNDDDEACAFLADYIFKDTFPDLSGEDGVLWLEKAANLGNINAMGRLAVIMGNICQDEKASYWFNKAKEAGLQGVEEVQERYTSETYPQRLLDTIRFYQSSKEYSKALGLLERNVNSDNQTVRLLVGKFFLNGIGEDHFGQDIPRSITIFEDLSAKNNHFADYELGMIYMAGYPECNIEQDIEKAKSHFIKSAEEGDAEAQFVVGDLFYNKGIFSHKDPEKAAQWIESAARQDHKGALGLIACSYLQDPEINSLSAYNLQYEQDIEKGMKYLKHASELGDSRALYVMATCCQKGKYVEQDYSKAFELLQKCVQENNDRDYVCLLGDFYRDGIGTEVNYEEAARCYQWAADNNSYTAMASLSNLYREGKGVEKNEETALNLMYKANEYYKWDMYGVRPLEVAREHAKQGDADAMFQLGNRYSEGDGVDQNMEVASDWWLRATMKGHIKAAHNLGHYYFFSKHDVENGLKWLNKSAEANEPLSLCVLGDIYLNGWGIEKDVEKGLELINMAADLGYPDALIKLATLYHDGTLVEVDFEKAKQWLEKYLSYDSAHAHFLVGRCLYNGDMYEIDYPHALEHFRVSVMRGYHEASPYYIDMLWRGNHAIQNQQEVLDTYKALDENDDEVASYVLYTLYNDDKSTFWNKGTAVTYLKKSAEEGYSIAIRELGLQHMKNGLFETDYSKAYDYLLQASDLGDAIAMVNIAIGYQYGREIEQDTKKALEFYLKAADLGDIYATRQAAQIYMRGEEGKIDVDIDKAIELLERFAKTDSEARFLYAFALNMKCEMENNYSWELAERAFLSMLEAASEEDPDAMYSVAYAYLEGRGVLRDMEMARWWFDKTLDKNHRTEDINEILSKYFSGDKNAERYPCYVYWYNIVEKNLSKIQQKEQYIDGDGYMNPSAVARGAAQLGEVNAAALVGCSLLDSNPEEAWKYLKYIIDKGYTSFANMVGKNYYNGDNVKKDTLRAAMYFKYGAKLGDISCKLSLGLMYTAEGVTKGTEEMGKEILQQVCEATDEDSEEYKYAKAQLDRLNQRDSSSVSKISKGFRSLFGKK